MCIHCCRLRRTPCPPIPYCCPHCPVRTISSSCPLSRRSSGEDTFMTTRPQDLLSVPCGKLPARWLEVNRRAIDALAKGMNRSPEVAHYAVLFLLYANYGKVHFKDQKRFIRVRRSGFPEQELFSIRAPLLNDAGYLNDPMAPNTLGKLLRRLQEYIHGLRQLNIRDKWYANGEDRGDILWLLGEQDELVRLLRELFGDSDVVPIPKLLRALNDLNFNLLFGKLSSGKSPWPVKSISDLYSEVVNPYKAMKYSSVGSRASANQMQEAAIHTVIHPKNPQPKPESNGNKSPDTGRPGGRGSKGRVRLHRNNDEQLLACESVPRKTHSSYLELEMPRLFPEPLDTRKSSTCRTRSASERVLPNGPISRLRVGRSVDSRVQR